jgi:Iron-containing redox enzyme
MTLPAPRPLPATHPLPAPRGPLSAALLAALTRPPHPLPDRLRRLAAGTGDPLTDEDVQLSLHLCYELHYRGLAGVDERWEWQPSLLGVRAVLEGRLERALQELVADRLPGDEVAPAEVPRALAALVAADDGPALSAYLHRQAGVEQWRELLVHRSVYQLKEADPHTWAIPRLTGRAKAALVEVQADEYGGGRPERMHSALFATAMRELGLDDTYGAYLDRVPATTLATSVTASFFGLHRRWRGAAAGHLAALEMTSSVPMRRYAAGLRRLGFGPAATTFFDEHVEADAVHEQVAAHDLCGGLVEAEPELAGQVLLGAACSLALDARMAAPLLDRWQQGLSSLRAPIDPVAASA